MSALREVLEQLLDRRNLSEAQAADLLVALTDPTLSPALGGALPARLGATRRDAHPVGRTAVGE